MIRSNDKVKRCLPGVSANGRGLRMALQLKIFQFPRGYRFISSELRCGRLLCKVSISNFLIKAQLAYFFQ